MCIFDKSVDSRRFNGTKRSNVFVSIHPPIHYPRLGRECITLSREDQTSISLARSYSSSCGISKPAWRQSHQPALGHPPCRTLLEYLTREALGKHSCARAISSGPCTLRLREVTLVLTLKGRDQTSFCGNSFWLLAFAILFFQSQPSW